VVLSEGKDINQRTALEIPENEKTTLETHSRIQNARGQADDSVEDRRTTPQVLITTRADLTNMDVDISPVIVQKTTLETPVNEKTTLETHSRIQNSRGHRDDLVEDQRTTPEVLMTTRAALTAMDVDISPIIVQKTTLETPENEKTALEPQSTFLMGVQNVRGKIQPPAN